MAKISLRVYNREIETMIDRGQTEEAIAHCKFILKTYPKHLETYRLLGKTFLESQRYSEAADILQRILSVQPDDFVSQIGMSIIREDEGNLDAAIYHMERAFEIQPSNAAIQDELRRLYGRRDGIEPPKLRLTRGALVRMYARGDLYRQAIAESRAALKEDPQRLDLEIVLARMYFQTGQKAEAAEISSRLITKLPYCFEANRILAEVLPETTRAEDARGVQQKLLALDPYLGYSESMQGTSQSPDNAVTLDRLEWMPSMETDQQPAWARSLGVKIDDAETEKMPKWMNTIETGGSSAQPTSDESAASPFSEEPALFENRLDRLNASPDQPTPTHTDQDMPDWMQSAGWAISDHPATEEPVLAEETPELDTATPAELPSWLKEMAPDQTMPAETQNNADWLGGIDSDSPPWTSSQSPQSSVNFNKEEAAPTANEDLPEWLKPPTVSPDETFFTPQNDDPLPDWLMTTAEMQTAPSNEPDSSTNLDLDWLTPQGEPGSAPAEMTTEFSETSTVAFDQEIQADKTAAISLEKQKPQENPPSPEASAVVAAPPDLNDFDQAMAWLESLAAKQGAEEETLISNPAERPAAPPEWVSEATQDTAEATISDIPLLEAAVPVSLVKGKTLLADEPEEVESPTRAEFESISDSPISEALILSDEPFNETQPAVETGSSAEIDGPWTPIAAGAEHSEPNLEIAAAVATEAGDSGDQTPVNAIAELPEPASDTTAPAGEMDMDAAFAWLESLAAKQGAEADTLLVSPETRQDSPPDWVQQQTVEAELPVQSIQELPEEPANRTPGWIQSSEETPGSAEVTQPFDQDLPDWLKETESSPQTILQSPALPAVESSFIPDETDALEEPPIAETVLSAEIETPTWIQDTEQVEKEGTPGQPEQEAQKPQETQQHPAGFGHTRPLPSWLAGGSPLPPATTEERTPITEEPALPDWLKTEEKISTLQPSIDQAARDEGDGPALPDWLKNLEPDQEEDLIPNPPVTAEIVQPTAGETEISSQPDEMIGQAQTALSKGHIDLALTIYARLIEKRQHLEESIHDLRDALYRYPVDSAIWQTLGDAYFQNNRVQDALDAYTKAEDFLK